MRRSPQSNVTLDRRNFLKLSAFAVGGAGTVVSIPEINASPKTIPPTAVQPNTSSLQPPHLFNGDYSGAHLNHVAFPLGGIGAGMFCLEGTGCLSHFSLRHRPEMFNEPCLFAAIGIQGRPELARVLEGPVPARKIFGRLGAARGGEHSTYGLPRFAQATFTARFPSATVKLSDPALPLTCEILGWSPFEPGDADNSSLPVAALEYSLTNTSHENLSGVFSINARNFLANNGAANWVDSVPGGFILKGGGTKDRPWEKCALGIGTDDPAAKVNPAWFRGGWWDALTLAWKDVTDAACYERPLVKSGERSPGGTLFVPVELAPGGSKKITVGFAWYAGESNLRVGDSIKTWPPEDTDGRMFRPWYTKRFPDVRSVGEYFRSNYKNLRRATFRFRDCFYDSTLPSEVIEAVAANLTILKSPTVLRQFDGRLWAWEGCNDDSGCCAGSCTHVWNYAQALPHLFPTLERTLRETEFGPSQDQRGHQTFRSCLPIRTATANFYAAADGQLGGIMKIFRDWRISGDTAWLKSLWPRVRQSLEYCIKSWDPKRKGLIQEPHHNTYDIEFWGATGMCTSFYLGALQAAVAMGKALNDDVSIYADLLVKGSAAMQAELFNGDYFFQKVQWEGLQAKSPVPPADAPGQNSEAAALLAKEGPKYQYGTGCLADGVLGAWLALVCGVGPVLDQEKVASHLRAVHRHNLKRDLSGFSNPQRPTFAWGSEGGLLLCTWPKGGQPSLPFVYSNEVWTGIEYQVASHLMRAGMVKEGLEVVRTCRTRYDGAVRNPFNEYECGHWYARAMSSYALLFGLSGARYDAVDKVLHLEPRVARDFRCFLATASGYGTVGVKNGQPFYEDAAGKLDFAKINYVPCG